MSKRVGDLTSEESDFREETIQYLLSRGLLKIHPYICLGTWHTPDPNLSPNTERLAERLPDPLEASFNVLATGVLLLRYWYFRTRVKPPSGLKQWRMGLSGRGMEAVNDNYYRLHALMDGIELVKRMQMEPGIPRCGKCGDFFPPGVSV